jgi:hypothetical protein
MQKAMSEFVPALDGYTFPLIDRKWMVGGLDGKKRREPGRSRLNGKLQVR